MKTNWQINDIAWGLVGSTGKQVIGKIVEIEVVSNVRVCNVKRVGDGNWIQEKNLLDEEAAQALVEKNLSETEAGRLILKQRKTDIAVLAAMTEENMSPKKIAEVSHLNQPAVRGSLARLFQDGKVKASSTGWIRKL